MLELLKSSIKDVFPNFEESKFDVNLKLRDIPGWDSMNAVNLLVVLEGNFNCEFDITENFISEETTVSELMSMIKCKD